MLTQVATTCAHVVSIKKKYSTKDNIINILIDPYYTSLTLQQIVFNLIYLKIIIYFTNIFSIKQSFTFFNQDITQLIE